MALLIVCAAIAMLILLLVLAVSSRINMRIRYSHSGKDDQLILIVHAWKGLLRYRLIVPSIMTEGRVVRISRKSALQLAGKTILFPLRKQTGNRLFKRLYQNRKTWQVLMKTVLRKVECTRFRLDFRVGTGDAPSTAVLAGALWSLWGCVIGALGQWVRLSTSPSGQVFPVYNGKEFSLVWEADFRFRPLALGIAVLRSGNRQLQFRKLWQLLRPGRRNPQTV